MGDGGGGTGEAGRGAGGGGGKGSIYSSPLNDSRLEAVLQSQ